MKEQSITVNAESLKRALIGDVLELIEPELPELTPAHFRALRAGKFEKVLADLRGPILAWRRHAMRLPDWYVTRYAAGLEVKRKMLDALARLAFEEVQRHEITGANGGPLAVAVYLPDNRRQSSELERHDVKALSDGGVSAIPRSGNGNA